MGDGLTTFTGDLDGLEIIDEPELEDSLKDVIDQLLLEEGLELVEEYNQGIDIRDEIVIVELIERIGKEKEEDFLTRVCQEYDRSVKEKQSDEYKEYLRLRAKFEPGLS